jgi:hypothetical protein
MWFLHPRREQIFAMPPPRTSIGTIGALHIAQADVLGSST